MRGRYVIAGIGHTAFGKLPGRTTVSMNVEACRAALADAGVEKGVVDAVFVKQPTSAPQLMYGQKVAEALGLQPRIGGTWDQGGAANIAMIGFAITAIEAGQCDVALITFADNPRTGSRAAFSVSWGDDGDYGWAGVPAGYAMIARAYIEAFRADARHFGAVVMNARANGALNPAAQLRKPIALPEYLAETYLVDPLRRSDCALLSDGGGAIVVMSARRAAELHVPAPVAILGYGQGQTTLDVQLRPTLTTTEARTSAATAFRMAGVTPKDIDVAELYDCFSIVPLMTLEDYGFCPAGQAGPFCAEGGIRPDGALPCNTAGGLLSETGMPGMQLIHEAVRQLRGTANLQVRQARTAVVSNQGGIMHTHATLILGQ